MKKYQSESKAPNLHYIFNANSVSFAHSDILPNFEFYHLSKLTEQYKNYYESLIDLNDHCSEAIDFRNLFDGYDEAIFFDEVHTGNLGNKIISERISHAIQHYL